MVNDLCVSAKFAGKQRKGLMLTTSLQPVDVEGTMIFSTTHSGRNPGTWSTPEITLICLSISISFISVVQATTKLSNNNNTKLQKKFNDSWVNLKGGVQLTTKVGDGE